ncbi:MFS transporter [Streptomyces thinghirensis]|nr:MFS transporter [Streptomyces thinghirensis]
MHRPDDHPDPNRWRALWVTLVAGFMTLLDVTIVAVALPSMQQGLHASAASVQWVVSGYALTFALTLVTAGRIGDAFGRRRVFLAALAAFVLCSAAAGAAPGIKLLVVARLAQGSRRGLHRAAELGTDPADVPGRRTRARVRSVRCHRGCLQRSGPVVGGLILALAGPEGWRWIFYVQRAGRRSRPPARLPSAAPGRPRRPGTSGPGGRAAPRHRNPGPDAAARPRRGRRSERGCGGSSGGVLVLFAFARWERRVAPAAGIHCWNPASSPRPRGYVTGAGLAALHFVGFSGVWLVFALFFQNGLGFSPSCPAWR